jgi:hypothetical protein
MVQGFGDFDPRPYGMDAAIGFPPWGTPQQSPPVAPENLFDLGFRGNAKPYGALAAETIDYSPSEFRFFPGVCPDWDNSPRRGQGASMFFGSRPTTYGAWLEAAGRAAMRTQDVGERLVFINAWNEWAEGAYLEPDRHFGFAYLAETARTLIRLSDGNRTSDPAPELDRDRPGRTPLVRRLIRRAARKVARLLSSI